MALELEELRREQAGYEQQIQAVDEAIKAIQEQIDSMSCTVSQNKVFSLELLNSSALHEFRHIRVYLNFVLKEGSFLFLRFFMFSSNVLLPSTNRLSL